MKSKKGISLIVLIITIIVVIILASVVILTLTKNNPIESAKEAAFKSDISNIQDELSMYISKQYTDNNGNYDPTTLNLIGDDMVSALPSTKKYKNKIKVENGKLVIIYENVSENEVTWFEQVTGNSSNSKAVINPYEGKQEDLKIEVGTINSSDAIAYLYKLDGTDEYDVVIKGKGVIKGYDSIERNGVFVGTTNDLKNYKIENCYVQDGISGVGISSITTAKNIILPNTITTIGICSFASLSTIPALETITLPDDLKVIGEEAFGNCGNLNTINFPDGLTTIQNTAFALCTNLSGKVVIPGSTTNIGDDIFYNCNKIQEIIYEADYISENLKVDWNEECSEPVTWKNLTNISSVYYGNVPIPKGFTYVEGTKDTGLVIQDSIGNQFVWVPATSDTYKKDSTFLGCNVNTATDDTMPSDISDENKDVKKYAGFYIARYEAGIPDNQTVIDGTSAATSNTTGKPTSKRGKESWTYINYLNAKVNAESMYKDSLYVKSGLLTGKAWDTACNWIKTSSGKSIIDSRNYGNHSDSISPANVTGCGTKQSTGYSDKWCANNIYDMAGNVWEWTNEISNSMFVNRGGGYNNPGQNKPISYRFRDYDDAAKADIGFR